MSAATSPPLTDPKFIFESLNLRLKGKPDMIQQVAARVAATTDYPDHESLYSLCPDQAKKLEVLTQCLRAVLKGSFDDLKGKVPRGQAPGAVTPAPATAPTKSRDALLDKVIISTVGFAKKETVTPPAPPAVAKTGNPVMEAIANLTRTLAENAGKAAEVDPAAIRAMVDEICDGKTVELKNIITMASQAAVGLVDDHCNRTAVHITERIEKAIKSLPPRDVFEIRKHDGTFTEIKDRTHKQFKELLTVISARNALGWTEFLWVHGAPGAGKSHLLKQLAQALGIKGHCFPCGPTTTEGKLLGFNNIATGSFVQGWVYDSYKNGGLVGFDEGDLLDAQAVGGTNSLDNDEFTFGNGEVVKRHKDFYLIIWANTKGTGSAKGFQRNKLDAATMDRFTILELEYDEQLERDIYGNRDWAEYVIKVREYVKKNCNDTIYITPRATRKGAAYLAAGLKPDRVCDITLFKAMSPDIKQTVITNVGEYKPAKGAK